YRVFDFNRRDKDGNLRELHTSLAVDAIDYKKRDDFKVSYPQKIDTTNSMVDCPYFKTNFLELSKPMDQDLRERDSFTIYMCVGGEAIIKNDWGSAKIKKGETVLVSASSTYVEIDAAQAKLLEVTI
ncbi:MAG: mannose-6-phosphate isomerase, partial [Bacteroidota bacterium]|nr:mannose-6-phosphate isomerase [Bacteroidota bacterium]